MNSDLNVENNVYVTVDVTARKFLGDLYAQIVKSTFGEFDTITVNGVQIGTIQGSTRGNLIGDIFSENNVKILENGTDGTDATFTGSVIGNVTGQVSDISNHSIDALSDVDITTVAPSNGQTLVWNAASSKFIPGGQGVGTTDDVTFSSLTLESLDVAIIGSPDSTSISVVNSTVFASDVTVDNNLVVQGNLTVLGTETIINSESLVVKDPVIFFAKDNQTNILDIGIVGSFNNGVYQHTGLIRDASDNIWRLFSNYLPEPEEPLDFTNVTYDDLKLGTLIADQINSQYIYGEIITNLIDSADSSPITVTPKLVTSSDLEVQGGLVVGTTAVVGESVSSLRFIGNLEGNVTGQVSDISNHSLGDLGDVDLEISIPQDLDILTWNAGVQRWVASGLSNQGLFTTSDVTFNSLTATIYTNYIQAPDSGDIVAANRFIGTHDIISENNIYSQNDIIATRNVEAEKFVGYLDGIARDIDDTALTNKEFATELDINLDQVFVYDVSAGELKKTYLSEIVSSGAAGYTGSQGATGPAGEPGYTGSRGLGLDEWIRITANYTAASGNRIIADTTTAGFTITLPPNPDLGAYIVLTDGGDWSINPLIISAGGASIEGYTEDVIVDIGGVTTELLWDGSMWQITATLGAAGNPGPGVPDGGTTGQVLAKVSNTDYDTAWVDPSGGGADLGSLSVTGSTISTTDSSAITIDRNLVVDGDLLPESDSTYDLGSPTRKWHSLYVSGNSIYINDTALTVNQDGDLLVGGALPQSNIVSLEDIPDVVISGATPGQVLGYTGSNWTATTVEGGGGGADSYVKTYFWEGALQENVSLKRFYIHVASTLETITVNLGAAGLTQSTIKIKRNDQVLNTIVIPANTTYVLETVNHPLGINDYLTVDITQSSSAANLYVTFVYRE
jgi:hypothetical protein